jgi:hypothetical protein
VHPDLADNPALTRTAIEAHRFSMPVVREIAAPGAAGHRTQRALVVASLVRCAREDTSRRWA